MYFLALATDYDGTLAHDGVVDPETIEALRQLKQSGRRVILVTGRELADLQRAFPELDLCDMAVVENGALLSNPTTDRETPVADPPPEAFVRRLQELNVRPLSIGRSIVATWEPMETVVLEAIRELGLELQITFNKGAVMVLPAGISKASGLEAALGELGLSRHNLVGVGDAENDRSSFGGSALDRRLESHDSEGQSLATGRSTSASSSCSSGPNGSPAETLQRERQVYDQAFGFPIAGDLTSELASHRRVGEQAAEALVWRLAFEPRPAMLRPCQQEFVLPHRAVEADAAARRREGAKFGCVAGKLMQKKRKAGNGAAANRHVRPSTATRWSESMKGEMITWTRACNVVERSPASSPSGMLGSVRSWARESAPSLARTASANSGTVRAERVLSATTPPARVNRFLTR